MRRPWAVAVAAVGLGYLFLTNFVSPFSYLPNPRGAYHLLVGGYHYDPHSLFVNRFATLKTPDPTPALVPKLERLLGLTGLDPLDPQQPLIGYRVREIVTGQRLWNNAQYAEAIVEFRYVGEGTRSYRVPVWQYGERYDGSRTVGWRYTGLDVLFTPHEALPDLPLAGADGALQIGAPRLLGPLPEREPQSFGIVSWGGSDPRVGARWAPDGQRFLFRLGDVRLGGPLWTASADGSSPRQVAMLALDATWSADGRLVYLRCQQSCPFGGKFDLVVIDPATGNERTLGRVSGRTLAVAGQSVYLADGEALWRVPLAGGVSERLAPLRTEADWSSFSLAITSDAERVAYGCEGDVCLADQSGANPVRISLGYPLPAFAAPGTPAKTPSSFPVPTSIPATRRTSPVVSLGLAWSPDGERLAITAGVSPGSDHGPELWIVDRAGAVIHRLPIGPDGATGEPTWASDGRTIVLTTFPRGGRRIVAIDAASGQVTDLSQPRWDTNAVLAPDGERLLLWNGRGNFWLAPLVRRAGAE